MESWTVNTFDGCHHDGKLNLERILSD